MFFIKILSASFPAILILNSSNLLCVSYVDNYSIHSMYNEYVVCLQYLHLKIFLFSHSAITFRTSFPILTWAYIVSILILFQIYQCYNLVFITFKKAICPTDFNMFLIIISLKIIILMTKMMFYFKMSTYVENYSSFTNY